MSIGETHILFGWKENESDKQVLCLCSVVGGEARYEDDLYASDFKSKAV